MRTLTALLCAAVLMLSSCSPQPRPAATSKIAPVEAGHIPENLDECFVQLKALLPSEEIQAMSNGTEDEMIHYHFGLGRWMRNNWGLWGGSPLAEWFNDRGIEHPDDMSGIILDSFWRHLNDRPINLGEQIGGYQDYWRSQCTQNQDEATTSSEDMPFDEP